MSDWMHPDHGKTLMARYLRGLGVELPEDVERAVRDQEAQLADVARLTKLRQDARTRELDEKAAILDSDVPVKKGAHRCEATNTNSSSWAHTAKCSNDAVVVRTYTTGWGDKANTAQIFLCGVHRKVKGTYGWPF